MRKLILIILTGLFLVSCKSSKHGNCDAYSQKEIKKDHQI